MRRASKQGLDVPLTASRPSGDLRRLAQTRATCPFLGSAILDGALVVHGPDEAPLARIDELRALGQTGGGGLGHVLAFFARANHQVEPGAAGGAPIAAGFFSLDLPGSQGSHPGHSGILEADPDRLASGRFSRGDYERLMARARDAGIARSAIADFIAENMARDPAASVQGVGALRRLAAAVGALLWESLCLVPRALAGGGARRWTAALGRALGTNNLIGSCGEWGLLLALLSQSPRSRRVAGELVISVADLDDLFVRRTLPEGWRGWRKTAAGWASETVGLWFAGRRAYGRIRAATPMPEDPHVR